MSKHLTLADRLKATLSARGITQSELGRRTNLTAQAIQAICCGRAKSTKHGPEIAAALDIDTAWLMFGEAEPAVLEGETPADVPEAEPPGLERARVMLVGRSRVVIDEWVSYAQARQIYEILTTRAAP